MKLPMRGGCQCGALRFEIIKEPMTLYCCHCTSCQQQSSSAFGMSMLVERDGFRILKGLAKWFDLPVSGKKSKRAMFCNECGTRILHDTTGHPALSLKAGTLDIRSQLRPVGHIWVGSAHNWMVFDGEELIYEEAPDDGYFALMERWAAQEHA